MSKFMKELWIWIKEQPKIVQYFIVIGLIIVVFVSGIYIKKSISNNMNVNGTNIINSPNSKINIK